MSEVKRNPKEEPARTRRGVDKLRDSVLSNDVFWRLLGNYLSFGDLQVCRQVSQKFNRKILDGTNFRSRGFIKLDRDRLRPSIFGSTVEKWKNVHIEAIGVSTKSEPMIDLTWLYSHLSDVDELYVSADRIIIFDDSTIFYPPLHKVLDATNSLKKLCIDEEFLSQTDVSIHLPSSKTVDDTLASLKELELTGSRGRLFLKAFPGKLGNWMGYFATAFKNVRVLRTNRFIQEDRFAFPPEVNEELQSKVQNLLRIIEGNQSHITSLRLNDMQLWSTSSDDSLQSLSRMVFPSLNSLKICLSPIEAKSVIQFLKQHPLLRDIDVTVLDQFPAELLKVILERPELRRLSIKTKTFEVFSPILWERLSHMNNLVAFALKLVPIDYYDEELVANNFDPSAIVHLPRSVEKIHLTGIRYPMHQSYMEITRETLLNLNPTLLTELCISKCGTCVNNKVMEFVCRTFRFLRVLSISKTSFYCTDYGFTGRPLKPNSTPFSISNLRGLTHLTLKSCRAITDETLIHGVKFTELRYLDISNNNGITQDGLRAVLAQNPSLEVLKTSKLKPFESEEELRKLYPRLKDHKFTDDDDDDSFCEDGTDGSSDDEDPNYEDYGSDSISYSGSEYDYEYDSDYPQDQDNDGDLEYNQVDE